MSLGFAKIAKDLIDKFGTLVEYRVISRTQDSASGTVTESAAASTIRAAVVDYDERMIDGTVVQIGDLRMFVAARDLDADPVPTAVRVMVRGQTWTVVRHKVWEDGDETAAYEIQLRSA